MGEPQRIIVIEDDREFGEAMVAVLTAADHEALLFNDPNEALEKIDDDTALVIVEYGLKTDGLDVCRQIQADYPDTRILLVSGAYRAIEPDARRRLPANHFLTRPFAHYELIELVDSLLHGTSTTNPMSVSGELPMTGTLGDYPFEALLYKLFDTRFTGRLVLERRKSNKVIYFLRGFPSSATSNTHAEALGTLLVNRGIIRRGDLNRQLDRLRQEGGSFGELLIKADLITEEQLQQTLDEQVRERVISCFEMRDGSWGLYPGDSFALQQDNFYIQNPILLIFLGISRFEETNALAERIQERASHHVIPTRHFSRLLPYFPLGENRRNLLAHIDGNTTLAQLLHGWKGDFPAFFRVIWSLMASRLIFLSPSAIPARLPPMDEILEPEPWLNTFLTIQKAAHSRKDDLMVSSPRLATVSRVRAILDLENKLDELNYFELFEVSPVATPLEVRAAVEQRIKALDPKALKHLPPADVARITKIGRRLKQAAQVLLDPDQRAAYRSLVVSGDADADLETGLRMLERGQITDAHAIFSKVEAKEPANARACALLGRTLHLMNGINEGTPARAKALIERAIALDENYAAGHFFLGALLTDLGEEENARRFLDRAIQLDPTHDEARRLRAKLGGEVGVETMKIGPWLFDDSKS